MAICSIFVSQMGWNLNEVMWSVGMTLDALEKQVIQKAYRFFRGNKTMTSNSLGISVRTLDNKLERYEAEELVEQERKLREEERRNFLLAKARGNLPDNVYGHAWQNGSTPHPGTRVESITNTASQSTVSMPERKEVQAVLPEQTSKSSQKRGR